MVDYAALRARGYVGEENRQGQGLYGERGYSAGEHLWLAVEDEYPRRLHHGARALPFEKP